VNNAFKPTTSTSLLSAILAGFSSSFAYAQADNPQPGPTPASQDTTVFEEVIVTAQKERQSIYNVGMAINALSGAQLDEMGVKTVGDLTKVEPSFILSQNAWGSPVYTIRGVGYNDYSIAASPAVSVYQDEIPYAYSSLVKGAPLDAERVEILKGPQGTLYGQNATGGAINYITAKPTDSLQAAVEGTYGRFGAANVNGFVSGPVSDTIKMRLAVNVDEGGAWQKSFTRDDTLGDKDNKQARLLTDWSPSDNLQVLVNLNGWTDNSQTEAAQLIGITLQKPALAKHIPSVVNAPLAPDNPQAADWLAGTSPSDDESFYQGAVRAEYTIADNLALTYLGSYQHYRQNDLNDVYGINANYSLNQSGTVESNSQELRLNGKLIDNKLTWILGGNFARTITDEDQYEDILDSTGAYALTSLPLALHEPAIDPFAAVRDISTDASVGKAVFGNLQYAVTESLSVHAGGRFTQTDINHSGCTQDVDGNLAAGITVLETIIKKGHGVVPILQGQCVTLGPTLTPVMVNNDLDQNNVSWRAGVDWKPADKTLLYASASKGYKAGSFPTLPASSYLQLRPVTQESVVSYEVGAKSLLPNHTVELSGALFRYNYDNKQFEARQPDPEGIFGFLQTLLNVPRSEETGAELTAKVRPVSGLTLSSSVTYLDSKVSGDFINYNVFSSTPVNFKGEPFPFTPKWALGLGARYDWEITSKYNAYVGADARYQTETQATFGTQSAIQEGFPSFFINGYGLLNLRAGINSYDGHWRFEVFGNNVTNTYYWTTVNRSNDVTVRLAGMPATYGITVGYHF
jgi:iron complex outermembrane recepter protein